MTLRFPCATYCHILRRYIIRLLFEGNGTRSVKYKSAPRWLKVKFNGNLRTVNGTMSLSLASSLKSARNIWPRGGRFTLKVGCPPENSKAKMAAEALARRDNRTADPIPRPRGLKRLSAR